jgi:hypothetical protein
VFWRYADTPMPLADAGLIRRSELDADCRTLTLEALPKPRGRRREAAQNPKWHQ